MNPREEIAGLGWAFAHRLAALIECGLVTARDYIPWADQVIESLSAPPDWILTLAITRDQHAAIGAIQEYYLSAPNAALISLEAYADECVAGLFLRCMNRELSWADFLEATQTLTRCWEGRKDEDDFYDLMMEFKESASSKAVEETQRARIEQDYCDVIESVERTWRELRKYEHQATPDGSGMV